MGLPSQQLAPNVNYRSYGSESDNRQIQFFRVPNQPESIAVRIIPLANNGLPSQFASSQATPFGYLTVAGFNITVDRRSAQERNMMRLRGEQVEEQAVTLSTLSIREQDDFIQWDKRVVPESKDPRVEVTHLFFSRLG